MTALRILLVEDVALNRELFLTLLEEAGHHVVVAETGARVRLLLPSAALFDVVLMDILLPDALGTDLLDEFKVDPRWQRVPVVALTAQALQGDRERLLAAGFSDVITKPINTRTFVGTIENAAKVA